MTKQNAKYGYRLNELEYPFTCIMRRIYVEEKKNHMEYAFIYYLTQNKIPAICIILRYLLLHVDILLFHYKDIHI